MDYCWKFARLSLVLFIVVVLLLVLMRVARSFGTAYATAVPPAIAIFQKLVTLTCRTEDGLKFIRSCFLSIALSVLTFLCNAALIFGTNLVVGPVTNGVGALSAATIAEVASPAAAIVVMFHLIIFIFELEGGINVDAISRGETQVAPISTNEQPQNNQEAME